METTKNTLLVLERLINDGLTNNELDFFVDNKQITFDGYLGAKEANGGYKLTDIIPAGLFVWGVDNHIGVPDAVFTVNECSVAFYKL